MENKKEAIKGIESKNIILLLVVAFIIFVAYKYTSLDIQENKEKEIIQERAKVQQQTDYQQQENDLKLDACIAQAEQKKNDSILYWQNYYKKEITYDSTADNKIWLAEKILESVDKIKAEAQVEKNNCYARYK